MFEELPENASGILTWTWPDFEPYFLELLALELTPQTLNTYLQSWTRFGTLIGEVYQRLYVAKTRNTADPEVEDWFNTYLETTYSMAEEADQRLKEKLLDSGLEPEGFDIPLKKMRADAELFRDENLPLQTAEEKMASEYDEIVGRQTIIWNGTELPLPQARVLLQDPERMVREQSWTLTMERQLADRGAINELWKRKLDNRLRQASNAGFSDYRSYMWLQKHRFDYGPEESVAFQNGVAEVVVPAAERLRHRRRESLGLDRLRPWDLDVDEDGKDRLRPFETATELIEGTGRMFNQVDRRLGDYFQIMVDGSLLDLDSRKNKAPGGYCTTFAAAQRPFIFMNAAGTHRDVETLLHEGGHAFHSFQVRHLPYAQQRSVGHEFAEVASMSMELLAAPYLSRQEGGFYSPAEAARARRQHLERVITLLTSVALVDGFQHWVYSNPDLAEQPDRCDEQWSLLFERYNPGVDWSGYEDELSTGWHRILHIHQVPLYYIEYGIAQLAAIKVWEQAREDQGRAVDRYLYALSLGGTRSLPELFQAIGADFDFTARAFRPTVALLEQTIEDLRQVEAAA
ncbi:MAG TPA: M3 family oligoendopeptidase [Chloroflexota bacterium]|nr:M3 family oligoendopeptidase [Chloroflexota bacterium]